MRDVDYLVVGLGGMGSAALYHLARMGKSVVGIEQFELDHKLGSSHGHSRAVRTFYRDPLYTELAEAALPLWQELEKASGVALLHLSGWLGFARGANTLFDSHLEAAKKSGIPFELMDSRSVSKRFPALRIASDARACFTPRAGFIDASRAVQTHLSEARKLGAQIHANQAVDKISCSQDSSEVTTKEGCFRAHKLIVTAGPWAGEVLRDLGLPLQITRQQKFYFDANPIDNLTPQRLPVYADYDTEIYGFPLHGAGIKVADDKRGVTTHPDRVDRTLDLEQREKVAAWLARLMPEVRLRYVEGSTCMYTMTPDEDFLIGRHPKHPSIFVAAGFSGHGFKFSTLVGLILAELATDGKTRFPISRFALNRFHGT